MRSPKISIVLCTCNGEAYLRGQIDSLLAQTYPFHELIVQDDCSTDSTGHIIRSYSKDTRKGTSAFTPTRNGWGSTRTS